MFTRNTLVDLWLCAVIGLLLVWLVVGAAWTAQAQEATAPTPLEQCQQDLRAQILDYRQCQASCANAQFRAERILQADVQALVGQREKAAQEKYDKLKTEYEALLQQLTPKAAAAQ